MAERQKGRKAECLHHAAEPQNRWLRRKRTAILLPCSGTTQRLSRSILACFAFYLSALLPFTLSAQQDYQHLRTADKYYKEGQYTDAEIQYRKALVEKQKITSTYNLGNSIYGQNRMDEAAEEYKKVITESADPELKSKAFFNLGNTFFQQQKFGESIQAYKEALKIKPNDEEAKKNLMLALRQLKQQQQQQNEEQQQQQQKQQQQQQQQPSEQDQQQPPKEEQQNQQEEVSEDEAREILKAIEREDQRVQEKMKKSGNKPPPVKYW